jgi:hypothetical protein
MFGCRSGRGHGGRRNARYLEIVLNIGTHYIYGLKCQRVLIKEKDGGSVSYFSLSCPVSSGFIKTWPELVWSIHKSILGSWVPFTMQMP